MNWVWDAPITLLLLSIVMFAAYHVKKHLRRVEIAVQFLFFSAVLSDLVIVISLNNKLWKFSTDGLVIYALNLTNRLVILPTMSVLFTNDMFGRTGLLQKTATFLKWLLFFLFIAYLSVWMDLVEYLHWPWYMSILEWTFLMAVALSFAHLYRFVMKREYGQGEVIR